MSWINLSQIMMGMSRHKVTWLLEVIGMNDYK
jgi:hypothetical protein